MSPTFKTCIGNSIHEWQLQLYPERVIYDPYSNAGYVGLLLNYKGKTEITVSYTLSIRHGVHDNINKELAKTESITHNFNSSSRLSGSRVVLQSDPLRMKNNYYNDYELRILCDMNIPDDEITDVAPVISPVCPKRSNILNSYETLLENEVLSDVTFTVDGKDIKAHKCILSKRSSVFKSMFEQDMKENRTNTVEITDIKSDVFKELLRYVYADKVNGLMEVAEDLWLQQINIRSWT